MPDERLRVSFSEMAWRACALDDPEVVIPGLTLVELYRGRVTLEGSVHAMRALLAEVTNAPDEATFSAELAEIYGEVVRAVTRVLDAAGMEHVWDVSGA